MLFSALSYFFRFLTALMTPMLLPIIIISATWDADLSARVCRSIIR